MAPDEITGLIQAINGAYPGRPPIVPDRHGLVLRVWHEDVGEFPFELAWQAFARYRAGAAAQRDGGAAFPPSSGQLRALVLEAADPVPGFAQVWSAITAAISRHGIYCGEEAVADLAAVRGAPELVAAMGGWQGICLGGTDEYQATPAGVWRAQAEHAWRDIEHALKTERVQPALAASEPLRLPGRAERVALDAPTRIDVAAVGARTGRS